MTSCDPLRVFLYDEGLVRFCTEKYQAPRQDNLNIACMHLTNYALNKHNVNFEADNSTSDSLEGSKWSLNSLKEWMEANGQDWDKIWGDIGDMTVKTVLSVQPILSYFYQSAFPIDNDGFLFTWPGRDAIYAGAPVVRSCSLRLPQPCGASQTMCGVATEAKG